jgi:hypothetical protein
MWYNWSVLQQEVYEEERRPPRGKNSRFFVFTQVSTQEEAARSTQARKEGAYEAVKWPVGGFSIGFADRTQAADHHRFPDA